jgi:hypothetical protein
LRLAQHCAQAHPSCCVVDVTTKRITYFSQSVLRVPHDHDLCNSCSWRARCGVIGEVRTGEPAYKPTLPHV